MSRSSDAGRGTVRTGGGFSVKSWKAAGATFLFLALVAIGYLGTRYSLVEMKYARMNPIRDARVAAAISSGELSADKALRYSTLGDGGAAETLYLPPVIVLRALSAGHESTLSDLLFVRAHSYFLSHFFSDRRFIWLTNYYDAITGLDPDNPQVYLWSAQVVKLGQMIDDDIVAISDGFLDDGLKRFPRNWQMHLDLGFNLYFEFKGRDEGEKSLARLRARDHFATAAGLPGSNIDPNFVAELFQRGHEDGLAVAYAMQKYYEATEDQRNQLLRRISTLSDTLAEGIRLEEVRWRSGYSHIPVALFALTDDRGEPSRDLFFGVKEDRAGQ